MDDRCFVEPTGDKVVDEHAVLGALDQLVLPDGKTNFDDFASVMLVLEIEPDPCATTGF